MKYIYLILVVSWYVPFIKASAQTVLTAKEHALRHNDKTIKTKVDFFDAGAPGTGILWDFSMTDTTSAKNVIEYIGSTDSVVVETAPHDIKKNVQRNDSLFLCAYRNRLYDIEYTSPVLEIVYPMLYGDTLYSSYSGSGLYCGKRTVETSGETHVSADAYGELITPSGDTLRNIVRVHTLRTSYLWMPEPDGYILDRDRKLCVEENYKWYARGFRYPVVETVSESYYDGISPVSYRQAAFLCLPDGQQLQNDTINMQILKADSMQSFKGDSAFHYDVSVNGSTITVGYSLNTAARVSFIVSDVSGVVYRCLDHEEGTGGDYNTTIDCSGMFRGEYVLNINVNGNVYSSKIRLR